jgi:hypothetical protein
MLKFFDFIFYRVCTWYTNNKSRSPEFGATCVVSALQGLNVITLLLLFEILNQKKSIPDFFYIAPISLFLILNYIKYVYRENRSYAVLKEKYQDENRKNILVTIYFLVTVILSFGLVIYLGSKKW